MKKYYLIAIVSLIVIQYINSQSIKINNKITKDYIEIPGTKLSIIKPDNSFKISSNFVGLENIELEAGINITEIPYSFENVLPMFSKDIPPKNGKLVFEKDFIINGYKVKLYKTDVIHKSAMENIATPESEGHAIIGWIMLYSKDSLTLLVSARYPSSRDIELSDKFEKSILSLIYEENKKVNPLDGLSFSFDTQQSELKFASVIMQTGAMFNLDGELPTKLEDKTSYMIMVMPFPIEKEEQKAQAIKIVKGPLDENVEVKEINELKVNDIQGFEVIGYGKNKKGEDELNYSATFFTSDKHFVIHANTTIELESKLKLFKEFTRTFQLKE